MDLKQKIFAFLMISQLAVMQIGLNIFFANCCCKKSISQSIYPTLDKCSAKFNNTSCCKSKSPKLKTCTKNTCGKNQIKYSKGLDQAVISAVEHFSIDYFEMLGPAFICLKPFITSSSNTSFIQDRAPPVTGKFTRILQCSFLC